MHSTRFSMRTTAFAIRMRRSASHPVGAELVSARSVSRNFFPTFGFDNASHTDSRPTPTGWDVFQREHNEEAARTPGPPLSFLNASVTLRNQAAGCCCVMQWIVPRPRSRRGMRTIWRSGKAEHALLITRHDRLVVKRVNFADVGFCPEADQQVAGGAGNDIWCGIRAAGSQRNRDPFGDPVVRDALAAIDLVSDENIDERRRKG